MSSDSALEVQIELPLDRFSLRADFKTSHHVTGVFGESGSGKTSLLETIAGLRRRARGVIRMGGETWIDSANNTFVPPERRGVGFVPQDGLLFPHRDVRANLLSGSRRALRAGHSITEIFDSAVALLGLSPLLERNVSTLSGGERQRVALGRALCSGPRLLLLDEPLASLDLPMRRNLLPFLRAVREQFAVPMFLVSHDPIEVQALCDDLIVLRGGAIIARGAPREVLTNPAVFALAREVGFENILPCTFVSTSSGSSSVRLGTGRDAVTIETPLVQASSGASLLLSVPARDILLAARKPEGLSARNVVPGKIARVADIGGPRLVRVAIASGVPEIAVEVTVRACEELGLVPGREVYVVIKASACAVFGA